MLPGYTRWRPLRLFYLGALASAWRSGPSSDESAPDASTVPAGACPQDGLLAESLSHSDGSSAQKTHPAELHQSDLRKANGQQTGEQAGPPPSSARRTVGALFSASQNARRRVEQVSQNARQVAIAG